MSNELLLQRIREAMDKACLNMSGLCKKARIDTSYISKLMKGDINNPGYATLQKIADALDTTPEWLMGKEVDEPEQATDRKAKDTNSLPDGFIDPKLFTQCTNIVNMAIKANNRTNSITKSQYAALMLVAYTRALEMNGIVPELDSGLVDQIMENAQIHH